MILHNFLLVYVVRWKFGWNILPSARCSHQSGTVKFSRHQRPTDCRLHQFPDYYVVKFQAHLFTKPAPSSMLFQKCFWTCCQSSISGESCVSMTCPISKKKHLIHVFQTFFFFFLNQETRNLSGSACNFLYWPPKTETFIFHFDKKKQKRGTTKRGEKRSRKEKMRV